MTGATVSIRILSSEKTFKLELFVTEFVKC